eukprot:9546584-Alexandrium_andersonii.AAC.1
MEDWRLGGRRCLRRCCGRWTRHACRLRRGDGHRAVAPLLRLTLAVGQLHRGRGTRLQAAD